MTVARSLGGLWGLVLVLVLAGATVAGCDSDGLDCPSGAEVRHQEGLNHLGGAVDYCVDVQTGQWNGPYRSYYPNVVLYVEGGKKDGRFHGPSTMYDEGGAFLLYTCRVDGEVVFTAGDPAEAAAYECEAEIPTD